jgi:hypothetical protein
MGAQVGLAGLTVVQGIRGGVLFLLFLRVLGGLELLQVDVAQEGTVLIHLFLGIRKAEVEVEEVVYATPDNHLDQLHATVVVLVELTLAGPVVLVASPMVTPKSRVLRVLLPAVLVLAGEEVAALLERAIRVLKALKGEVVVVLAQSEIREIRGTLVTRATPQRQTAFLFQ